MGRIVGTITVLFCLAAIFNPHPAMASGRFPDRVAQKVTDIFAQMYNDRFDPAASLIDSLEAQGDVAPIIPLCRAALFQARMMATESDSLAPLFSAAIDTVITLSRNILARGGDSALANYFIGQAMACRALFDGRAGHTWGALREGLAAGKALNQAYRIDSSFHDAAVGLGSFRYWKSVKTKLLNWTPFFRDERQEGIRLLRLAADSSQFSADIAQASLIWIYLNEELLGEALRLADDLRNKYPLGMTFFWALGEAYFRANDYPAAAGAYEDILTRLGKDPGNYYNMVEAAGRLTQCYRRMADRDSSCRASLAELQRQVAGWPIPEKTRRHQAKKLTEIAQKID